MSNTKLSLRQVEIVDAVARHRSVSKAAEELHVTQSALSHALGVIETDLGVTLFNRTQAGVEPTAFVGPFVARASTLRAILADTKNELESQTKKTIRPVKIQCGFRAGALWATPAMAVLTKELPDFQADIDFNMQAIDSNLRSGIIDLALAAPQQIEAPNDFMIEPLGRLQNQLFASPTHPLTKIDPVTVDDLRKYPMVGNLIVPPHADFLEGNPGRLGTYDPVARTMQCAITINTIGGVIDVLRRSDGVARLPPPLVHEDIAAGYIVQLNDTLIPHIPIEVRIVMRKATFERREVRLFVEALKKIEGLRTQLRKS